MAITNIPPEVHPAFNEIEVVDNTNTSITVEELEPLSRQTTQNRVLYDGEARFNLRNFVSSLFYDEQVAKATTGAGGWAFKNYNLFVKYKIGAYEFFAINAVHRKGEPLDLINQGPDAILTRRERDIYDSETRIRIPRYEGYPVGVSALFKTIYQPDYSGAIEFVLNTSALLNRTVTTPVTTLGEKRYGVIDWGDGTIEEIDTGVDRVAHTYRTSATVTVRIWPNGPYEILSSKTISSETSYFIKGVTAVNNLPNIEGCGIINFRNFTALKTFNAVLPKDAKNTNAVYGMFRGCTALTFVNDDLFINCTEDNRYFISLFDGCTALQTAPNLITDKIRSWLVYLYGTFNGCTRLNNLPTDYFGLLPNCTDISYIFYSCTKMTKLPDFSKLPSLKTAQRSFYLMTSLTDSGIPTNLLSGSPLLTNIQQLFRGCSKITTTLTSSAFNPAAANTITNVEYMYYDCPLLKSVQSTFNDFFKALKEIQYIFQKSGLTSWTYQRVFPNSGATITDASGVFSTTNMSTWKRTMFGHMINCTRLLAVFTGNKSGAILPSDLFADLKKVTTIDRMFYDSNVTCTLGILDSFEVLTSATYMFTAYKGPNLTGDIFRNCVKLNNVTYFASSGSGSIGAEWTSVPENLFENCKELISIGYALYNIVGITGGLSPRTPSGYPMWEREKEEGYAGIYGNTYNGFIANTKFSDRAEAPKRFGGDAPNP